MKPPIPPPPPDLATPVSDRAVLLAARANALNAILWRDLSLGLLLWRSVQAVALGFSLFVLAGAWSEFRLREGDETFGYQLLALGAPIFTVMAATLLRGFSAQRERTRLLYAWTRAVDQPVAASPTSYADPMAWQTAYTTLRDQYEVGQGAFAYDPGVARPSLFLLSRAAWAVVGAAGLLVGAASVAAGISGESTTNVSGAEDPLAIAWMYAGWGAVLAVAGVLALRKAFRLVWRTQRVDPRAVTKRAEAVT